MTTIELRFLANRYHGTAWGRHVNEGVAEWPPSPYRLLRAMYDTWKRKCNDLSAGEVEEIFGALATKPPSFSLPKAVAAHTRSYLNSNTEDPSDKSLIFDAFVSLATEAPCFVRWDIALTTEQHRKLNYLLSSLNYLGRSESWVEARLVQSATGGFQCKPVLDADSAGEVTYVACPVAPSEYKAKQPWMDALAYSTASLLKDKLSGPPALRYVPYALPPDAVTTWLPQRRSEHNRCLSAAVLELHGKALPMVTDTVRVAERVRGRLMRHFELSGLPVPTMVHGKDDGGIPLKDHSHVFILPRANRLGRIDHVLIYTRKEGGFDESVANAIASVRNFVWIEPIRAVSAWMGQADDHQIRPVARAVKSSTPFITVRHWRTGRGTELEFMDQELRRECKNHGLPNPSKVEYIPEFAGSRFRRNREDEPSRKGLGFKMEFTDSLPTPFSLGYGCHFGLGQFEKD